MICSTVYSSFIGVANHLLIWLSNSANHIFRIILRFVLSPVHGPCFWLCGPFRVVARKHAVTTRQPGQTSVPPIYAALQLRMLNKWEVSVDQLQLVARLWCVWIEHLVNLSEQARTTINTMYRFTKHWFNVRCWRWCPVLDKGVCSK